MAACDYVSCETCGDTGLVQIAVEHGPEGKTTGDFDCPVCGGRTPAFIPGHDDLLDGAREGWHR